MNEVLAETGRGSMWGVKVRELIHLLESAG
jgi:hypothetical protein